MLGTQRRTFGNIVGHAKNVSDMSSLSSMDRGAVRPGPELGRRANGSRSAGAARVILKGILDAEDARLAIETGADAIIVSNHGGRQLDGAPSSIAALPAIVDAVGNEIEVHLDGGIRSGQDVVKALALGAKGTYIGRAFLYGLGAMGEAGVTRCLQIIGKELDLTMAFCGLRHVQDIDEKILLPGTSRLEPGQRCQTRLQPSVALIGSAYSRRRASDYRTASQA